MKILKQPSIKKLQAIPVFYLNHFGPYEGETELFNNLFNQIINLSFKNGILTGAFQTAILYHNDIRVVAPETLKTSVCVTVENLDNISISQEEKEMGYGKGNIESGNYATASFELMGPEFPKAWEFMMKDFIKKNKHEIANKPCYDFYPQEPKDGKYTVDICIPVN